MLIIDSHCDTPSQIMRLRNLGIDNKRGHVDFPKMLKGNIGAAFFALYTPASLPADAATRYSLEMMGGVFDSISSCPEAALAFSPEDIIDNHSKGLISILLGMENGAPIQHSLSLLRLFYRFGVRYMTLTHNGDNEIADSAAEGTTWNGLSPFGIKVIEEMNRLGMIIDIAHASDKTFYDCIEYSKSPIVSTHSCCRALASHKRNMTDDMIRKMADKGGVIQINFFPTFLSDEFAKEYNVWEKEHPEAEKLESEFKENPADKEKRKAWENLVDSLEKLNRPGVKRIVDHIDHAIRIGGIEHVGIGSDFDGIEVTPAGLENISQIGKVFDEMKKRGYSDDQIDKIAGQNFLRVFKEVNMKNSSSCIRY